MRILAKTSSTLRVSVDPAPRKTLVAHEGGLFCNPMMVAAPPVRKYISSYWSGTKGSPLYIEMGWTRTWIPLPRPLRGHV